MIPSVSQAEFRAAMARVCAPVNIVTTDGAAGRGGFTATAMCSVSDEPPTLLVCMNGRSAQCDLFLANRSFCVNVLSAEHAVLASDFAGATADMGARYERADWFPLRSGSPALVDAIVTFDCLLESVSRVGTHNVMIGRVVDVALRERASALLYFDRSYVEMAAPGPVASPR